MVADLPAEIGAGATAGCDLCAGTGTMTWQQPTRRGDGTFVLVEHNHPCVNGCSGWYKVPVAEQGDVVVADPSAADPRGNVARANLEHRTEWSRPRPRRH